MQFMQITFKVNNWIKIKFCLIQRRIESPDIHERWEFLQTQVAVETCQLCLQKASSQMFDRVLNRTDSGRVSNRWNLLQGILKFFMYLTKNCYL